MKVALCLLALVVMVTSEQCNRNEDCSHTACASNPNWTIMCEQNVCLCDINHPCVGADTKVCQDNYGSCSDNNFLQSSWHCVDGKCACSYGGFGSCLSHPNPLQCFAALGK
ncbi:serine protease inhibitor Cvsi-2-like [Mya arenaria]|uniref:serine protease inhibitor Cvsi-2-like n=1 Tax=Mya arenaria TaxID=6604 RepID=UPI0022E331CB|nr:serine protease inhibitor Cvsi-2-like [Mya arenaria]